MEMGNGDETGEEEARVKLNGRRWLLLWEKQGCDVMRCAAMRCI